MSGTGATPSPWCETSPGNVLDRYQHRGELATDCVVDCCVFGVPARGRIKVLRLGLGALAHSYGMS
jgi:hypothetical protein